jgi:hypothetical protein
MRTLNQLLCSVALLCCINSAHAQGGDRVYDSFLFESGQRVLTDGVTDHWSAVWYHLEAYITDPNWKITLTGYASHLEGDSDYTYQLALDRANAVKDYLVYWGVQENRIETLAYGAIYDDDDNGQENPANREVFPEFSQMPYTAPADEIDQYRNAATLQADIQAGKELFEYLAGTAIKDVKEKHLMVRKVFLQDPSDDPEVLLGQVEGILKEMDGIKSPEDFAKFVGKIGLDAFVDLFTAGGSRQVNLDRQVKYDVIKDATVSECFPNEPIDESHFSIDERILYHSVKMKMRYLNNHERYQIRAHFIAGDTFEMYSQPASVRFEQNMQSAYWFRRGLDNWFNTSEYRYRD